MGKRMVTEQIKMNYRQKTIRRYFRTDEAWADCMIDVFSGVPASVVRYKYQIEERVRVLIINLIMET